MTDGTRHGDGILAAAQARWPQQEWGIGAYAAKSRNSAGMTKPGRKAQSPGRSEKKYKEDHRQMAEALPLVIM